MRLPIYAWIRFLRLPNGLTVPGDVWVGAMTQIGSLEAGVRTTLGVLFAYWFGMALNDLLDLPRDRQFRPERPLPSGQIPLWAGWGMGVFLFFAAAMLVPSPGMAILLILIIAYTVLKERIPWLGPVLMALCRVCAIWIGAGSPDEPSTDLLMAGALWFVWIGIITYMGRQETKNGPPPPFAPVLTALFGLTVPLWVLLWTEDLLLCLPFALLWIWAMALLLRRLHRDGRVQPAWIGNAIRLLLPLQSLILAGEGTPLLAACLLPLWPLLAWLSRRFPMS